MFAAGASDEENGALGSFTVLIVSVWAPALLNWIDWVACPPTTVPGNDSNGWLAVSFGGACWPVPDTENDSLPPLVEMSISPPAAPVAVGVKVTGTEIVSPWFEGGGKGRRRGPDRELARCR